MSEVLKGLLQPQIQAALVSIVKTGTEGPESDAKDPIQAQTVLAEKLSEAIAVAVATYLNTQVTTIPLPTGPSAGPVTHVHLNIPHALSAK